MKIKAFLSILTLASILSGCASLHEQEKQFADTWVFCYKSAEFKDPMIAYAETAEFVLSDDGKWKFGESEGKWGNQKNEQSYNQSESQRFNLNFAESTMLISNHASQYSDVTASIQVLNGVETLVLSVNYNYEQGNYYQNKYGEVGAYSTDAKGSIEYYFVRKSKSAEDSGKLNGYFAEIKNKQNGAYVMNSDCYNPFSFIQKDTATVAILFNGLKYNEAKSLLSTKQRLALAALYALKGELENYRQLSNNIPIDKDSLERNRVEFLADFANGKRDFTDEEISSCSGFFGLEEVFRLLVDYKKVSQEELNTFRQGYSNAY